MAFFRERGGGSMIGTAALELALAVAGGGAGLMAPPTGLQYRSSWLPAHAGDATEHLPWLPLLVRRYDVVFSELKIHTEYLDTD